jgi:Zn-dependent alcohol dehydrogenase
MLKGGERAGVRWLHAACGHCEYCLTGCEIPCDGLQNTCGPMADIYRKAITGGAVSGNRCFLRSSGSASSAGKGLEM